ncbi:hypothetical protein V1281_006126 [Nitrobacteraceae bacterium AZCC 2161]
MKFRILTWIRNLNIRLEILALPYADRQRIILHCARPELRMREIPQYLLPVHAFHERPGRTYLYVVDTTLNSAASPRSVRVRREHRTDCGLLFGNFVSCLTRRSMSFRPSNQPSGTQSRIKEAGAKCHGTQDQKPIASQCEIDRGLAWYSLPSTAGVTSSTKTAISPCSDCRSGRSRLCWMH